MRWYSCLFMFICALDSEVIDRIAVSVGNQVVTEAQIMDEIRVTAFLNHQKTEFTSDQKKAAAERLIEQTLIKREMELSHYPLPEITEAEPFMKDAKASPAALAAAGITEADLQQHLWWQLTMLRFIE